jgi:uncharacterized RDD family membrane protein YckC/histone H3/H4
LEISDEAKARLTHRVSRIVADIDVYEAEKKEITRELTSNFYDHAMVHAQERGSQTIEKQDVEAVFAESEDPREIAAGYMASYVSGLRRAGFWPRFFAYIIDLIIFGIIIGIIIGMISAPFLLLFPQQFNFHFLEDEYSPFVEPSGPIAFLLSFIVGTTTLIGMITYFMVIEGRFGTTPGKMILGLRVLREDGTKIGFVDSIIRNIPKVVGNSVFLVIDALLMLLVFNKDKQRGFDKIARTIVVHKEKKEA